MRRIIATLLLGSTLAIPAMAGASTMLEWVPWNGHLPRNAVRGGIDQNGHVPLHICRAHHVNGVHPGKLLSGKCNIGWGGEEVVLRHFEVLVEHGRYYRDRDRGDYRDYYDYRRR